MSFRPAKVEVEIDPDVFTHCPGQRNFALVNSAKNCAGCEHFGGVIQLQEKDDTVSWENAYRIGCEHIVFRRTQRINMGEV